MPLLKSGFSLRATGIALLLQSSDTRQKCARKLITEKNKTIILEVGIVLLVMPTPCRYNKVITHECNHPSKESHCYSSSHRECSSAATVHWHPHTREALLCWGRTFYLTYCLAFRIWVSKKYFYNHTPCPLPFLLLESGRLVWNSPKRWGHRMSL